MAGVEVRNVSLSFGPQQVLSDISITFPDGGFYALLGPSGSGKTTLLRLIAGFDFPDSGSIRIDGEAVESVPVNQRRIGMVFQNYALFPNMSVADNVAFGLRVRGRRGHAAEREVARMLDMVQLGPLGRRRPHQLSGGQRQRVALARALITRPRVLLLDEPLSALDKALRADMQLELKRIQQEVGVTTIFVTHDQAEALSISDRVGILKDGRIIQEGMPEDIYDHPRTEFAATFLGEANIITGRIEAGWLDLGDGVRIAPPADAARTAGPLRCALRPEHLRIRLAADCGPAPNQMRGVVTRRLFSGSASTYLVTCQEREMKVIVPRGADDRIAIGAPVVLEWDASRLVELPDTGD